MTEGLIHRRPRCSSFVLAVRYMCLVAAIPWVHSSATAQTVEPSRWKLASMMQVDDSHRVLRGGLGSTTTLSRSPSGLMFVPQIQESRIVVFDSLGHFVRSIGRDGAGPGEFRLIGSLSWIGDTLVVSDLVLRRLSYFRVDGTFLRTVNDPPSSGAGLDTFGATADGGIVLTSSAALADESQALDISLSIRRRNGVTSEFFRTQSEAPVMRLSLVGTNTLGIFKPIVETPLLAISPGGSFIVVVEVPFPVAEAGSYTIHRFDLRGGKLGSTRRSFRAERVRAATMDSLLVATSSRSVGAAKAGPGQSLVLERLRAQYEPPKWYPAFDRIVIGDEGWIWLREASTRARWTVLDTSLSRVGTVDLVGILAAATSDSIWVIEEDLSSGAPLIVRYRLVK